MARASPRRTRGNPGIPKVIPEPPEDHQGLQGRARLVESAETVLHLERAGDRGLG